MMSTNKLNIKKSLATLLGDLTNIDNTVAVSGVAIDSRLVTPGDLFLAYRGTQLNGIDYINAAITAGAVAVAVDKAEKFDSQAISIATVKIANLKKQAGVIISRFYGEPSKNINIIGITGTNGKTTISYLIAAALSLLGKKAALLGTLGYGRFGEVKQSYMTTPDPVTLHSLFSLWQAKGINNVAMEVSSHALAQGRVAGTEFNIAIFTNLSRDHLDYHGSFKNYKNAKFQLFTSKTLQHAIINLDDPCSLELIDTLPESIKVVTYSTTAPATLKRKSIVSIYVKNLQRDGLLTTFTISSPWGECEIKTSLLGQFNVENLLAVYAALIVCGISAKEIVTALSSFNSIPGRMEYFSASNKPIIIVDYAHTPAALEKALLALRPYCAGNLYCIFGCGGNRDVGKRSQMGEIAEKYADKVILTNDNPRSEDPDQIIANILEGVQEKSKVLVSKDRSSAIINTFLNANQHDVILISGKGHETKQEINKTMFPFSDRQLARKLVGVV